MERIEDWVHVVTKDDCPWCKKAIAVLIDHDIPFTSTHVTEANRQSFVDAGIKTVPHITVGPTLDPNSEVIGGFEGLWAWLGADDADG